MAVLLNRIGNAQFVTMDPRPPGFMSAKTFEARAGVPGYSMWHGATRGQIFRVRTFADTYTIAHAGALWELYQSYQLSGEPQTIVWENTYAAYKVIVRHVAHDIRAILHGQGGLTFPVPSRAVIEATWELVAWETS